MADKWTCWFCGTKSEGATCPVCEDDLDEQREEMAALNGQEESTGLLDMSPPADLHGGHVGMWMEADGEPFHVLGDPNMSEETAEALRQVVRAARRMVDKGKPDEGETSDS